MKNFHEMMQILREFNDPDDDPHAHHFYNFLGEDGDEPFSIELNVNTDGGWEPWNGGSLLVKKDGASGDKEEDWTVFENPGRRLERVPEPIRSKALAWIETKVKWLANNYEPDDPNDYREPRNREWDANDQAAYDRRVHGFDREDI